MVRASLVVGLVSALIGLGRDPGCGSAGDGDATTNAPCTRARDCADGLTCAEGVCTPIDAGAKAEDADVAADSARDAGG